MSQPDAIPLNARPTAPADSGSGTARDAVVARLEDLPLSSWHVRARVIMGVATFFDAFDVLALATVLPVLSKIWGLTPQQIGALIAVGFIGQLIGALYFGWLAERVGRVRTTAYTVMIFAVMSLACAFAWNFTSLLIFRFVQGIGLGGEVPVAASYINELSKAKGRGRFFILYELIFPIGIVAASLTATWTVPNLGWQSMFIIGAAPALLALVLRRILPESPRWLVERGRLAEAEAALGRIERAAGRTPTPLPRTPAATMAPAPAAASHWLDLVGPGYISRTLVVWVVWFACFFVTFGLSSWLPTIYSRVYQLPLAEALRYGLYANIAGLVGSTLCAFLIDRVGRRLWLWGAFLGAALPLVALYWLGVDDVVRVAWLSSLSYAFVSSIAAVVYLYTPEIYPTRMRALGTGTAAGWRCVASAAGPTIVGALLGSFGVAEVFLAFAIMALVGVVAGLLTVETSERVLEDIAR